MLIVAAPQSRQRSDTKGPRRFTPKAAHLGRETVNRAAEIKLLADRKAGELLKQLELGHGPGRGKTCDSVSHVSDYHAVLKDTDTSVRTAQRWQKLAEIPEATP